MMSFKNCFKEVKMDPKDIIIQEDLSKSFSSCVKLRGRYCRYLSENSSKIAIVVEMNGHYVAIDGNKLVTARRILGQKVTVIVLNESKKCFDVLMKKLDHKVYTSRLLNYDKYIYFIENNIFRENPYTKDYFNDDARCNRVVKKLEDCIKIKIDHSVLRYSMCEEYNA